MQKIFELKGSDWMKGLSLQTDFPIGGLFNNTTSFDPFDNAGYLVGSKDSTELTAPVGLPKVITPVQLSGTGYFYVHTPTKFYRYLRESPYTQTDQTSSISVTDPIVGATVWKGRYIYAGKASLRSWNFNATDVDISGGESGWNGDIRRMCIGPDGNLYIGNSVGLDKATSATGTAGNTYNIFPIDVGYVVRDVVTDGTYLIIIADTNNEVTTARTAGSFNCRVYYWDMDTTTTVPNKTWDIQDSYLIGAVYLDGAVHIFGYSGLYICNYSTAPRMILDRLNPNSAVTEWPTNPYQITNSGNTIYWGDSATNGYQIMAYGSYPGQSNKIFYSPYITHLTSAYHSALAFSGGSVIATISTPKLYIHNVSATRIGATVTTVPIVLDSPYRFSHVKISLKAPLASGEAVGINFFDANGDAITTQETQSYSASNPRKNLIFRFLTASGSNGIFEDISMQIATTGSATVSRVTVYGTPLEDAEANL